MKIRTIAFAAITLALAAPAGAQRPVVTTQVKPEALNAARLQVVRAGPATGTPPGAGMPSPTPGAVKSPVYLSAAAKRALLASSGLSGNVDGGVIRVDAAPRSTRAFIHISNAVRVTNHLVWGDRRVSETPFASFLATERNAQIQVFVAPGGTNRYLVDCGVGSLNQFDVVTARETRTSFNLAPASAPDEVRHLRFLLELTDPAQEGVFRIEARETVHPWAFFGCELTPIT